MLGVIGEINRNAKPLKPRVFLCKPNKQTIATLNNFVDFDFTVNTKLYELNELQFSIPAMVQVRGEFVKNPLIDKIKERYLIRLQLGSKMEYYIIISSDAKAEESDQITYKCNYLPYELADKKIRQLNLDSQNATQALNSVLSKTIWSIGTIDPYFDTLYRTYDFQNITVLDAVMQISDKLDALILWDTVNRKISFAKKDTFGQYKGLTFSMHKYLKSLDRQVLMDEIVTRLYGYGKDGLTFNDVNPTGQPYIDDFSYFMYPFERDQNRNVIKHSDYMSDELCHAILDYNELVESKKGEFSSLLNQKKDKQVTLSQKQAELANLQIQLAQVQDTLDVQKQNETLTYKELTYNGTAMSITPDKPFKDTNKYAVFAFVSSTNNLIVKLDGIQKTIQANQWNLVGKIANKTSTTLELSGSANNVSVKVYMLEISDDEFSTNGNDSALIEKYIEENKQVQVDSKQQEINDIQSQINSIDQQINSLKNTLAFENHFTPELVEELNQFIIEAHYEETNHINSQELYDDTIKQMENLKLPKTVFNIDIDNFLEVVEAQRDWDKLVLGDKVKIKHEILGIYIMAQLLEIDYNFSSGEIKITIGNVTNLSDLSPEKKFQKMIYKHEASSIAVDTNRSKWNQITDVQDNVNSILNNAWDATKRKIIAGTKESVVIDNRGIRITNPTEPDNYLVANHAVLAITNDNGKTWKNAITTDGIVAERLIGKVIAGEDLIIQNKSGSFVVDDKGVTIDGSALILTSGQKSASLNLNNPIKETPVDTYPENNSIQKTPADPTMLSDNQAIGHVINPDGTATISFEWSFDGEDDAHNIDGFIVYVYASSSSTPYEFGTNTTNEHQFIVDDFKRALIIYNVPADLYYTFGVQAYRKVNTNVNKDGILRSQIVKPKEAVYNPYKPSNNTPFNGDILGTLTSNDFNTIGKRALNSLQSGVSYNGVQIDTNSGLVVTRGDGQIRTIANATDGIKIQSLINGQWQDKFYVDTDGIVKARGLVIESDDGDALIDAKNKVLDFNKFTAVVGKLKADNIEAQTITADQIQEGAITLGKLALNVKSLVNNWTRNATLDLWSVIEGTGTFTIIDDPDKNNTKSAQITTSTDVVIASDFIEIDPTKTYKVTASMYSSYDTGVRYFGFYCYDQNQNRIGVDEWNVNLSVWEQGVQDAYFWLDQGKTLDSNGNNVYRDMEGYILSSIISDSGVPRGRNTYKHFKLPPNAKYIRLVFANKGNYGTTTSAKIWSPTMQEADSPILTFDQAIGGQLTLGGADNGNGQLVVQDENQEIIMKADNSGTYIATLSAGAIYAPNIMTVLNTDLTYFVDPDNGSDSNIGIMPDQPFSTLTKAFNSLPQTINSTVKIQVVGTNKSLIEDVVVSGFQGRGSLTVDFVDTTNTLKGILKIVSNGLPIYVYNGTFSYQNNNTGITYSGLVHVGQCGNVEFNNCIFHGNSNIGYGLYTRSSYVEVRNSFFYNFTTAAILAAYGARVWGDTNKGSGNAIGVLMHGTGIFTTPSSSPGNSIPSGTTAVSYSNGSDNFNPPDTYFSATSSTPSSTPDTSTKVLRVNSNGSASWRDTYGWRNDNEFVYQGEYDSYGINKGFWFFPQSILSQVSGKTVKKIRLYITRYERGGDPYITARIRYHSYSTEASARADSNPTVSSSYVDSDFDGWNVGQWIDLPSSWYSLLSNGTIKGIALYNGDSDYAFFYPNATLEIQYV